jgi:antitoxin PrlF
LQATNNLGNFIMPEILYAEATLTERYQNTVPAVVRKALHLKKGDQVRYAVSDTGEVKLSRADSEQADPVIGQFLSFLANDMQKHPEHLQALTPALRRCQIPRSPLFCRRIKRLSPCGILAAKRDLMSCQRVEKSLSPGGRVQIQCKWSGNRHRLRSSNATVKKKVPPGAKARI